MAARVVGLDAATRKLRQAVAAAVALPEEAQDQVADAMQGILQQLLLASRCGELTVLSDICDHCGCGLHGYTSDGCAQMPTSEAATMYSKRVESVCDHPWQRTPMTGTRQKSTRACQMVTPWGMGRQLRSNRHLWCPRVAGAGTGTARSISAAAA
jgi:hypothetical protein